MIAEKLLAFVYRRGKPKAGTDWRDLASLLLTFPELKSDEGPVAERLRAGGATPAELAEWKNLVAQQISEEDDDEEFRRP